LIVEHGDNDAGQQRKQNSTTPVCHAYDQATASDHVTVRGKMSTRVNRLGND
jgi:hypothetical protein